MAPWRECAPCHSQPDGARLPLTRHPAHGTSPPTRTNPVREGHSLPTACRITPDMTTAGHQNRAGVATSRRPHPHLLASDLPRSPSLPIIPGFNPSDHRFGGFGLRSNCTPSIAGVNEFVSPRWPKPACYNRARSGNADPGNQTPITQGRLVLATPRQESRHLPPSNDPRNDNLASAQSCLPGSRPRNCQRSRLGGLA